MQIRQRSETFLMWGTSRWLGFRREQRKKDQKHSGNNQSRGKKLGQRHIIGSRESKVTLRARGSDWDIDRVFQVAEWSSNLRMALCCLGGNEALSRQRTRRGGSRWKERKLKKTRSLWRKAQDGIQGADWGVILKRRKYRLTKLQQRVKEWKNNHRKP